jgi:hypothetical protein
MPIRINLLAEAQAAEELRRKDPVKRAIMMGVFCIVAILLISVLLQTQIMSTKGADNTYVAKITAVTNDYVDVVHDSDRLNEVTLHKRGLDILSSERLLYGNLLNALQKIYVDGVQMIHVRTEHAYELNEPPAADKKDPKKTGKPATVTERITIIIEARDNSTNPGDKVNEFKQAISQNAYFASLLGPAAELRLANLSAPQPAPDTGRPTVQFSLEARPPEKIRLGINSPVRYSASPAGAKTAAEKKPSGPIKMP